MVFGRAGKCGNIFVHYDIFAFGHSSVPLPFHAPSRECNLIVCHVHQHFECTKKVRGNPRRLVLCLATGKEVGMVDNRINADGCLAVTLSLSPSLNDSACLVGNLFHAVTGLRLVS